MTAIGASSSLPPISAKVRFLNPEPALSSGGGNWPSCWRDPPKVGCIKSGQIEIAGRDRIDEFRFLWRDRQYPEMRPHRNSHASQNAVIFLEQRMVDRNAGIIDRRM